MKLTVHGPNLKDQSKGDFHVHTAACADNKKEIRNNWSTDPWTIEANSVEEVIHAIYADFIDANDHDPWTSFESDAHFAPCIKNLPRTSEPNNQEDTTMSTTDSSTTSEPTTTNEETTVTTTAPETKPAPKFDGKKLFATYLRETVSADQDAPNRELPFITEKEILRVPPRHWVAYVAAQGHEVSKRDALQVLKDAGLVQRVYPLPGEKRSLGLYTGAAPASAAKLPRRVVERKAPAAAAAAKPAAATKPAAKAKPAAKPAAKRTAKPKAKPAAAK